jgi:hypothetical protein
MFDKKIPIKNRIDYLKDVFYKTLDFNAKNIIFKVEVSVYDPKMKDIYLVKYLTESNNTIDKEMDEVCDSCTTLISDSIKYILLDAESLIVQEYNKNGKLSNGIKEITPSSDFLEHTVFIKNKLNKK